MKGTDPAESAVYQMSRTMGGEPKPLFRNGYGLNVSAHGKRLTFSRARAENKADIGFWIAKLSN